MGTIQIGRLGYLGLGIESPAGTVKTPDVFLNYNGEVSLNEKVDYIPIQNAQSRREVNNDSVTGKKYSEGDVPMIFDVVQTGYLAKLALGNELYAAGTPSVHTFYPTVSGNAVLTATLYYGRGDNDVLQSTYNAINTLDIEVADGLATMTAKFMGQYPTSGTAQTITSTSGTFFTFGNYTAKFGNTLALAAAASATKLNDLKISINNNLQPIYRSGSTSVDIIRSKGLEITGSYTLFFESTTDRDAYRNITKRAMQITLTGNTNESVVINVPHIRINEWAPKTGLDDFFVENVSFTAELDTTQVPNHFNMVYSNSKASTY
jgi:hypothetical protein